MRRHHRGDHWRITYQRPKRFLLPLLARVRRDFGELSLVLEGHAPLVDAEHVEVSLLELGAACPKPLVFLGKHPKEPLRWCVESLHMAVRLLQVIGGLVKKLGRRVAPLGRLVSVALAGALLRVLDVDEPDRRPAFRSYVPGFNPAA